MDGVDITNVTGNFPSSDPLGGENHRDSTCNQKDGATHIDIVMPVGRFLSGDYEGVCDTINELKQVCGDVQ